MKTKFFYPILLLCCIIIVSCSSDNDSINEVQSIKLEDAQFTFDIRNFGSDVEITRASKSESTDTINIGDRLEAAISIENDSKDPLTRSSVEMTNQHYTIYATKGGQIVPNSILKGTLSGNGANKIFTPDAGTPSKVQIPAGTYTFVCFNDALKFTSTGGLELVNTQKATMAKALIGTTTQTISGNKWKVPFVMRPCFARVRVKMVTFWKFNDIKGDITTSSTMPLPSSTAYNTDGTDSQTSGTGVLGNCEFANTATEASDYTYTSTSDYVYLLPHTDLNTLKLAFTNGELYRKQLSTTGGINFKNFTSTVKQGDSYTFKAKVFYKYNYLFASGTPKTGTLVANPGRTPIAAVINGNLAIALKNANNGNPCQWAAENSPANTRDNTNLYNNYQFSSTYNTYNGEQETYNGSNSSRFPGVIKANELVRYPAFYYAAHYSPGVSTTYTRWFLPSYGEIKLALTALCGFDQNSVTDYNDIKEGHQHWDADLVKVIMVQAGGVSPVNEEVYLSSTEFYTTNQCAVRLKQNLVNFGFREKTTLRYVHSFIHY